MGGLAWSSQVGVVNGLGGYFDSFNDCLRGGFGTPDDDDFIIEWHDHERSRHHLSHPETARQLEIRLTRCHPSNRPTVQAELDAARNAQGPTVFDWLQDIIEARQPDKLILR